MNFKFTTKRTLIFIAGLIAGGLVGMLGGNNLLGIPVVFATIYYIKTMT